MPESKDNSWTIKKISATIALAIGLIVGINTLQGYVKGWLQDDDLVKEELLNQVRQELLDSLHIQRVDHFRLKKEVKTFIKHYTDQEVKGQQFFALSLRVDSDGDLWYRNKNGDVYRVIPDYERWTYYYYDKTGQFKICFWEH